jgi:hypothetical protein
MALLLVLAAVVVGLSAATIAAQAATTAMVSQRVDRRQALVDDAALALGPALPAAPNPCPIPNADGRRRPTPSSRRPTRRCWV